MLCRFLFLFTRTKQASPLYLLVHFVFSAAILFLSTSSTYVQIRKWMDGSSWTQTEALMKRNKTKHQCLGWLLLRCCSQTCGRIGEDNVHINWAFACEITLLKVSRRLHFDILSVFCTTRLVCSSQVCAAFVTVFGDTSMLNLAKSIHVNTRAES